MQPQVQPTQMAADPIRRSEQTCDAVTSESDHFL
jgi:hypothetical protein